MSQKKRLDYIDIARGIAILLVIAGHTLPNYYPGNLISKWIYTFHMPLFFILSGYFFSPRRDFKTTVSTTARHTLFPYAVIHAIRITTAIFVVGFSQKLLKKSILPALYGSGTKDRMKHALISVSSTGMTWFLLALFWCRIFYYCLYRLSEQYNISIWILVTALAVFSIDLNSSVWLPFSLQPGITAMFFYHTGFWMKKNGLLENSVRSLPPGILPAGILIWILRIKYGSIGMHANSYKGIGAFMAAIIGTYLIVQLSKYLEKIFIPGRFLRWCGINSIIIYGIHALESAHSSYLKLITSAVSSIFALPSKKGVLLLYGVRATMILLISFVFVTCKKYLSGRKSQKSGNA